MSNMLALAAAERDPGQAVREIFTTMLTACTGLAVILGLVLVILAVVFA